MVASAGDMKPPALRILAIDPAVRKTGYAVLEAGPQGAPRSIKYGVITNHPKLSQSQCLATIHEQLAQVIRTHSPAACAIEGVIYVQSHRTAISLGAARGAALVAAGEAGLTVYEYAPRLVKQAVVGRGAADKTQVAFMVRVLLRLQETPPPDAADALAIGITHLHSLEATHPAARERREL